MKNTLRIGTRGSELALKQTELFIEALKAQHPQLETEVVIIRTDGDERTDIPLCKVNKAAGTQDKGVFVAAIERALEAGEIDCAVHSLKDMPGKLADGFEITAVLPREDIWDALILKPGANTANLTLGTSSVRRVQMIRTYWSGTAKAVSIRGNVHTRLNKLVESTEMDGIVLARAGLNRLGLTGDSICIRGLDIERIRPLNPQLVRHTMNEEECEQIFSSSRPDVTFIRMWTQKEAVLKLNETGITDHLQQVLLPQNLVGIHLSTTDYLEQGFVLTSAISYHKNKESL